MRHQHLVTMLSKYGKHRHLASMTTDAPYYSICGKPMNLHRTLRVLDREDRIIYPDCEACTKLL